MCSRNSGRDSMASNAHGYIEWGLESTNLAIFLKATPLIKDINCGGQSKYRQSILTDKPPFIIAIVVFCHFYSFGLAVRQ